MGESQTATKDLWAHSLANVLNATICIAVKGEEESSLLSARHNSSQKRRGERRNSACSSWTLHFPPVNTEINLGQAAKASPWRSILSSCFTAKQKPLQEIWALLPSSFLLNLYNVNPFIFLHTTLFLSFHFLSGSLSLLDFLKGCWKNRMQRKATDWVLKIGRGTQALIMQGIVGTRRRQSEVQRLEECKLFVFRKHFFVAVGWFEFTNKAFGYC